MAGTKVTVILPFRDAVKNIERSVNSILNQSFQDLELILVNDGSTDGSRELIENFKDERIKIINLASNGTVVALNEAIYLSQSDFIALMDPYDISRNDRIEKQYNSLTGKNDIDVISSLVKYIPDNVDQNIRAYVEWTNSILSNQDIYYKRFINSTVLHSTLMFKKSLITSYGLFRDGEFPEDYEILLRWMNKGIKFLKLDEELTEWCDDIQRLSRRHIKYNSGAASGIKIKYFNNWFGGYFRTQPDIFLWGNKPVNKHKITNLENDGVKIAGYVNEDGNTLPWNNDKPVFSIHELPSRIFIIYLAEPFNPGDVPAQLMENGLEEGIHYMGMS